MNRLPVTLIGGFFGAGKTSLLHHIISEHRGGWIAVLVDNPGALNLDAKALRGLCGAMRRTHDVVLEIPPGDDASQLDWIAARLHEFAASGRFEHVLIEVSGTTNAASLAHHFGVVGGASTFSAWVELEQIVCVVDALDYFRAARGPASEAALWNFQNEQIADATLIVLNKCDLLEEQDLELCRRALQQAHHPGLIIETAYGEIPPEVWAQPAARVIWENIAQRREKAANETDAPPLATALYRIHRPFHPQRFWNWFDAEHAGLLRVKGLIWLATRNLLVGGVSRTRWQNGCGAAGIWWAALPREEWPDEPAALMGMQELWREPYGDRRQELVLIGDPLLLDTVMRRQLDACLLTEDEFARTPAEWSTFPDPFPAWDLE